MDEDVATGSDNIVTEFNTYEDFLDSQITSLDLYYLEVRCGATYDPKNIPYNNLSYTIIIIRNINSTQFKAILDQHWNSLGYGSQQTPMA